MTAATQFIDARMSRHIGTFSEAVAIPAGAMRSSCPAPRDCGRTGPPEDFAEEAGQASGNA